MCIGIYIHCKVPISHVTHPPQALKGNRERLACLRSPNHAHSSPCSRPFVSAGLRSSHFSYQVDSQSAICVRCSLEYRESRKGSLKVPIRDMLSLKQTAPEQCSYRTQPTHEMPPPNPGDTDDIQAPAEPPPSRTLKGSLAGSYSFHR